MDAKRIQQRVRYEYNIFLWCYYYSHMPFSMLAGAAAAGATVSTHSIAVCIFHRLIGVIELLSLGMC